MIPKRCRPFIRDNFPKKGVSERDRRNLDRSRRAPARAEFRGLQQRHCTICVLAAAPPLE
jgi:hypothetical protein